jgi:hypothetical protein
MAGVSTDTVGEDFPTAGTAQGKLALHEIRFFTESRENEDARFGVAGQKSRQRLECVCLQHRFPFAATRQASPHGSRYPEAKAPVKPLIVAWKILC